MTRIELSITADYVPGWGLAEGIREMISNARDAEVELSAPMTVSFNGKTQTLAFENEGVTLDRNVLLIGQSSKRDRSDTIGRFGEGLDIGVLALIRGGHPVVIRSGGEVWTPCIEPSEKFGGASVLVFNIVGGREERKRVRVEIGNVAAEDWKAMREHFLFLDKKSVPSVVTDYGTLLTSDRFRGRIYVKGILVQTDPKLSYGYDLSDAELDRDRRIIASWDLETRLRRIWNGALAARPDLFDDYVKLLDNQAPDVTNTSAWNVDEIPEAASAYVAQRFAERHGKDAVPVNNMGESQEVEHLGKRGIVVSRSLIAVLTRTFGDLDALKGALKEEVIATFSWHDLDETERANLTRAVALVNAVEEVSLANIDIVDFRSKDLLGQFKGGRLLLVKRILADRRETLATLVHEASHRQGGDGEKNHVAQIERIWSHIVENVEKASAS
jgi:hypothetical protein